MYCNYVGALPADCLVPPLVLPWSSTAPPLPLHCPSTAPGVQVWSLRDNSCLHTLVGQRKPVTVMRLRAHGRLLLAASGRKIRVWDAVGFRCLQVRGRVWGACGGEGSSIPVPTEPRPRTSRDVCQRYGVPHL